MKKKLTLCLAMLALVVSIVSPALAGEKVARTGWIVDEWCGAKNANADGAGCAKSCAEKGAELVLFSDGELIKLSDRETALKHIGYEVVVRGEMSEGSVLAVESIEKAKDDA